MQVDLKSFEVLEQKIQRTVELVSRLKDENGSLRSQLASFQATAAENAARSRELDTVKLSAQQLEKDLRELQDERKSVLTRVDGLLANLERLQLD